MIILKVTKNHTFSPKDIRYIVGKTTNRPPSPPPPSLLRVKEEANKNWLFISNVQNQITTDIEKLVT